MTRLTEAVDYDASKASGNVPSPRTDTVNNPGYYVLRTRCVPQGLPANMTKLQNKDKKLL
ncbi:unnamed protein product [Protopolystoma xenopodis]|uniref:Uncharacterized protein n=1 Tax=Protopolystoma xenopodis TaxID=117903 RepID=A0A3S5BBG4_9PLAT|nr:unnamed protein product [Protopolystoma xenopodis]